MKTIAILSALVGAAFLGVTSAQTIPACVLTCSTEAAAAAGCSSYADVTCVCTSAEFQNAAGACLVANCSTADQQTAVQLQAALCGSTSVTSGSVSNTLASATGSTSINTASLTSEASSLSSSAAVATSSSAAAASSASTSRAASSSAAASAATSSAAATSKSAGDKVEFGIKSLVGAAVAVVGVAMGATTVL